MNAAPIKYGKPAATEQTLDAFIGLSLSLRWAQVPQATRANVRRELLDYFGSAERPVAHDWCNWNLLYPASGLTLAERLSGRFHPGKAWVRNLFKPLPIGEAELLQAYGV